ncbi:hypothetical protein [Streptomyces sp. NBC_01530]|uniref:hypothetical protein n=1 Tax=Streptomyces sp. NBC_01530 TaxID=2903895 RepID=UPI00386AF301
MPEAVPSAATGRAARTAEPRRDTTAADAGSLERMGRIDEQPIPAPSIQPFLEPDLPPPPADETS